MLLHRRLGHENTKNLNRLAKNEIVRGLPVKDFITFEKCVPCAQGKHHHKTHKSKLVKSISKVLQLLHLDLFGPINILSINNNSYCLIVNDDYSRFTWVCFLSNKSGIADMIKRFIVMIENQKNEKVKALRTDNALFGHHNKKVLQNGEIILLDIAKTMLCDSKLSVLFWVEAINTENVSSSCSCTSEIVEDEEEDVVYRPPLVTSVSPIVVEVVPSTSPSSPSQRISSDAEATPLTPREREFITRDSSTTTPPLMKLLFPEPISNEYVASTSHGPRSLESSDSAETDFSKSTIFQSHSMTSAMKFPPESNAIIRSKMSLVLWMMESKQETNWRC
ncbi:uncharacterized protein LOC111903063 [Lactuca sativa]|uniref:uncharacterized protein LOC111903063 n=1 Tax=Lactuca sativa TaxID=4236 RepID=UPI000CD7F571|nr:uncharacterized protein LOC111903063 [Lactuca sativa]